MDKAISLPLLYLRETHYPMNITEEIEKQVSAGFSVAEIKANLQSSGFSNEEIKQHVKAIKAAPAQSGGRTPTTAVILLIVSIIRGILWISRGQTGLGIFFVGLGVVGFIAFAYSR